MFKIINVILLGFIICTNNFAQQKIFGFKISGSDDIISDVYLIHKDLVLDSAHVATDPDGKNYKTYSFEYYNDGKLKRDYNIISFSVLDNTQSRPRWIWIPGYQTYFYNDRGDADSISTGYWYNDQWHGSTSYRNDYVYNTFGRMLSKTVFSNGVITKIEQNSYDLAGNLILNKVINPVLLDTTVIEYDEQNRIKFKKYIINGVYDNFTQYEYQNDSTGNNNCTITDFNVDDPYPAWKYYFEFDEFGKTVNEVLLSDYNPVDSTWGLSVDIPFDYNENDQVLNMGDSYRSCYNTYGNLDTLVSIHIVYSGYLGGRATLVDSYGNIIRLPNYIGFTNFYYSELITSLKERKENEINFTLYQNYPNPFNPNTVISWHLAANSHVNLSIYNSLGQKICTLISEKQAAGSHRAEFDGAKLASGIYFYKLQTGKKVQMKKMLFIK